MDDANDLKNQTDSIKKQIANYRRRLNKLEEKRALLGTSADPAIELEIEDIEKEVAALEKERERLKEEIQTLAKEEELEHQRGGEDKSSNPFVPFWRKRLLLPDQTLPSSSNLLYENLRGYNPFPSERAEDEEGILFGEVNGFWSHHSIYVRIAGQYSTPQIIRAATGMGKTAFAQALVQIGRPDGSPVPDVLPIYVPGFEANEETINQCITKNRSEHPEIRYLLLAIDFNLLEGQENIPFCVKHIRRWQNSDVIVKLFVPDKTQLPPSNVEILSLTWDDASLRKMAEWRFAELMREVGGEYRHLREVFEEEAVYSKFIKAAEKSPRLLAKNWNLLMEAHKNHSGRDTIWRDECPATWSD